MNTKLAYLFLLSLLAVVSIILVLLNINDVESDGESTRTENREHQELIFLLQYIGRDYQNAVEEGVVINDFEYREIQTFCQRAIELYLPFEENPQQNLTLFQLQQLREMVYEKTYRESIWDLSKTLIHSLTKELDLETYPASAPDIERGRRLYQAGGCDVCHGVSGAGDGYAADGLEPGPGSFQDPSVMREAAPYPFFNVTLLGVDGTGMPSYEQAFSREDIWDVAFYLMTLRDGFDPRLTAEGLNISLEDLSTKSDFELIEEIHDHQSPVPEIVETQEDALLHTIDFLRKHPDTILEIQKP
ncbi:cytochrome c [bacterium]|nr:cytochrome c [bacterium]